MLCAPKTVFTAGLMLTALSGAAQALTVTQDQVMTQNGQNFTFTYSGLPASDGTGGTVTISNGRSLTNPGVWDGIDIDSAGSSNEYVEVFIEGQSFGRYNCTGRRGHIRISGCSGGGVDQIFSLAISLTPAMLTAALSDASLTIMLDFSRDVNHLGDRDVVRSALTYNTDPEIVPTPMSALLLTTGLLSFGAFRRRTS